MFRTISKLIAHKTEKILFFGFLLVLYYATLKIFDTVYRAQPAPYIDEIFHIPQAKSYCKNNWTQWDPKITTLPGLYIVSYILLKPIEAVIPNICNVYSLRYINLIGTLINFVLGYKIMSKLHYENSPKTTYKVFLNLVSAINVAIFPPLYFFTFLYYTDVWSTTFVLFMYNKYLSAKSKSTFLAGVYGFAAVMMRQTNIIWVGFLTLDIIWNVLYRHKNSLSQSGMETLLGKLKFHSYFSSHKKKNKKSQKGVQWDVLIKELVTEPCYFVIICKLFIIFLIINGSVVVGDKVAHSAVFHPMQFFYFLNFTAFFGLPYFIFEFFTWKKELPSLTTLAVTTAVSAFASEINKVEHPYLLADNRHLAFYIWRRIFGHNLLRRLIIPTYAVALFVLIRLLGYRRKFFFKETLLFCIFLNLTFQNLFELRYFILPFVLCRLNFRQNLSVYLELFFYSSVNFAMIYLFLNKPFRWESEPNSLQRFVW